MMSLESTQFARRAAYFTYRLLGGRLPVGLFAKAYNANPLVCERMIANLRHQNAWAEFDGLMDLSHNHADEILF